MTDQHVKCPNCGDRKAAFKGQKRRLLQMSPMGRGKRPGKAIYQMT
jgi:hypothetical protein